MHNMQFTFTVDSAVPDWWLQQ